MLKSRYKLNNVINSGRYGTVYKAHDYVTGKDYAIKMIPLERHDITNKSTYKNSVLSETRNMWRARGHANIVYLYNAFKHENNMCLVEEYCGGSKVSSILNHANALHIVLPIIQDIAHALAYLKSINILFLDIKPENIVADITTGKYKLTDFGSSKRRASTIHSSEVLCTPYFASPEVVNMDEVGHSHDVWALGILMYWLLSGKYPFQASKPKDLLDKIARADIDMQYVPESYRDILSRMLDRRPNKRIVIEQVVDVIDHLSIP